VAPLDLAELLLVLDFARRLCSTGRVDEFFAGNEDRISRRLDDWFQQLWSQISHMSTRLGMSLDDSDNTAELVVSHEVHARSKGKVIKQKRRERTLSAMAQSLARQGVDRETLFDMLEFVYGRVSPRDRELMFLVPFNIAYYSNPYLQYAREDAVPVFANFLEAAHWDASAAARGAVALQVLRVLQEALPGGRERWQDDLVVEMLQFLMGLVRGDHLARLLQNPDHQHFQRGL